VYPNFQENRFCLKTNLKFKKNNQQILQSKVQSSIKPKFSERQDKHGKKVHYVISILYTRPEFGEKCEFLSTYYAKEKNGARHLKRIFVNAFKSAHPTWTMMKITVSQG
jgi:hypothetical protein